LTFLFYIEYTIPMNTKDPSVFGVLLLDYMNKHHPRLTQQALADAVSKRTAAKNNSQGSISKIIHGDLDPSWEFLEGCLDVFDLNEPDKKTQKMEFIAKAFFSSKKADFPISRHNVVPQGLIARFLASFLIEFEPKLDLFSGQGSLDKFRLTRFPKPDPADSGEWLAIREGLEAIFENLLHQHSTFQNDDYYFNRKNP